MRKVCKILLLLIALCTIISVAHAQQPGGIGRRLGRQGGNSGGGGKKDSLEKRNPLQDSITINFRYLDSSRMQKFDSSIYDFTKKYPAPWTNYHLGNIGNASRSMVFSPLMKPGFDPGFHAYDVYNFNDYETRFYNTTRPYSELNLCTWQPGGTDHQPETYAECDAELEHRPRIPYHQFTGIFYQSE